MSERKINLEEILSSKLSDNYPEFELSNSDQVSYGRAILAMKEACRQILELAAENADLISNKTELWKNPEYVIDKQSILNTIKQIE